MISILLLSIINFLGSLIQLNFFDSKFIVSPYINQIYFSRSINIALHGEPSAPAKFKGAAFKK